MVITDEEIDDAVDRGVGTIEYLMPGSAAWMLSQMDKDVADLRRLGSFAKGARAILEGLAARKPVVMWGSEHRTRCGVCEGPGLDGEFLDDDDGPWVDFDPPQVRHTADCLAERARQLLSGQRRRDQRP